MSLICIDLICPSCKRKTLDNYYDRDNIPAVSCGECGTDMIRYYGNQKFSENRTWSQWQGAESKWGLEDAKKIGNYKELQKEGLVE